MSDINDSERSLDDEESPILPDEDYREARGALGGQSSVPIPPGGPSVTAEASEEQLLYAKILATGMYLGLAILMVTFTLYVTGIMAPVVPIEELPNLWTLSAHEYLQVIDNEYLHTGSLIDGWSWVTVVNRGDFLNFIGIALLALVTIGCYLGILPTLLRKKDWIYAGIAVMEVLILALAASGIVAIGH
jgi:hypothetical protein